MRKIIRNFITMMLESDLWTDPKFWVSSFWNFGVRSQRSDNNCFVLELNEPVFSFWIIYMN